MYNLLIFDENSEPKNEILNYISNKLENITISSISTNEKESIESFLKSKRDKRTVKNKIDYELNKICFNFKYVGTKYLSDCIHICSTLVTNIDEINSINLTNEVFPIIARKYKKTVNSVKTNINRSSTNMYFDCNQKDLNQYFNRHVYLKPQLKDLIFTVLSNI